MRSLLLAAVAFVGLSTNIAHAENWERLGASPDGTIFEIDLDSIHKVNDGNVAALISSAGKQSNLTFDCRGKVMYRSSREWQRFPLGSALNGFSDTACLYVALKETN